MGAVDKLEIEFENVTGVYREGDWVCGHVIITNCEEVNFKAIRLEVCGIAIVHWTQADESIAETDPDDLTGDINKEQYFHKEIALVEKDSNDETLTPGEHIFPFDCKLPPELPSSFEGRFGQVRYLVRAWIERPGHKSNVMTRRAFTVLNGLNLNFIPECAAKIDLCKYKQLGSCCVSGSVTVDWAVDRSGFVPGEDIWVHGSVQNDSRELVAFSRVALYMVIDYKSKKRRKRERRKITSVDKGELVPDEVCVWQDALHIPPMPPSGLGRCRMININYELEFKVLVEGGYSPINFTKDIYIGTVPVCRKEMKSCIAGMFNQPYNASHETLDHDSKTQSQVSLTQIIAFASREEHMHSPTAPMLLPGDKETGETLVPTSDRATAVGGATPSVQIRVDTARPPPFAPGHCEEAVETPPSAPGEQTLLRPWPDSPLNPLFKETELFGPVSLRESGDDQASIRGSLTYHPVYPYYPTLRAQQPEP